MSNFLVSETMSPHYVRSKVCLAPIHVQSKVPPPPKKYKIPSYPLALREISEQTRAGHGILYLYLEGWSRKKSHPGAKTANFQKGIS